MYPLALGIAIRNNALWAELTQALRCFPFRVVADLHEYRGSNVEHLAEAEPDVVFVETPDAGSSENIVAAVRAQINPAALIVALHPSPTVDTVVSAIRAGANEFLQIPIAANLGAILERAQTTFSSHRRGSAVGFVSVKGGCGSSTIACHSAVSIGARLDRHGKRALLIDLDLSTGVGRFIMKCQSSYSVVDAVQSFQKLDWSYWESIVAATHPGLDVLSAPENLHADLHLDHEKLRSVLAFARRYYAWTILDLGRGMGQLATSVLAELSDLYLIATDEITPLHMTRQIFRTVDEMKYPRERVRFVLNRMPRSSRSRNKEIAKVLGIPVFATLPNDYSALYECYSYGRLLPRRSKLARGISSLSARIIGEPERTRSLLARLLRRKPKVSSVPGLAGPELPIPPLYDETRTRPAEPLRKNADAGDGGNAPNPVKVPAAQVAVDGATRQSRQDELISRLERLRQGPAADRA